ncbi:hypothetical protein VCRLGP7_1210283 [Vibrio crassostreae]|nr:hypothetical protein VCRA2120E57_760007 [Vibrio crassostreae]CDT01463.1 hypothetical protein VCRLGP7_1210283 [Vibrio crassostreae]
MFLAASKPRNSEMMMPKKLEMIAICKLSAKPLSSRLVREKSGGNILDSNRSLSPKPMTKRSKVSPNVEKL